MHYEEFVTAIQSLDRNKLHLVKISPDTSQQKMLIMQKVILKAKLKAIIVPDTMVFEELTEQQIEFLLRRAKPEKPEPSTQVESGIMTKGG